MNAAQIPVVIYLNSDPLLVTTRWVYNSLFPAFKQRFNDVVIINSRDATCDVRLLIKDFQKKTHIKKIIFALASDSSIGKDLLNLLSTPNSIKYNFITDPDINFFKTKKINKLCDVVCIPFIHSLDVYLKQGLRVVYFPYCANIDDSITFHDVTKYSESDVNFMGSPTGARVRMIKLMGLNNIKIISNIKIEDCRKSINKFIYYKSKPIFLPRSRIGLIVLRMLIKMSNIFNKILYNKYSFIRLSDEEYKSMISQCHIALSILEHQNTDLLPCSYSHIRMRDMESLAAGAILITRLTPDIKYLLDCGMRIFCYNSKRSVVDVCLSVISMDPKLKHEIASYNIEIIKSKFHWGDVFLQIYESTVIDEQ